MNKASFQKEFGKHLKKVRKERGISLRELELRCDVDRASISEIESGKINPTMYTVKKLCIGMEISFSEFFKDYK